MSPAGNHDDHPVVCLHIPPAHLDRCECGPVATGDMRKLRAGVCICRKFSLHVQCSSQSARSGFECEFVSVRREPSMSTNQYRVLTCNEG
jgi:hypothetical protein